MPVTAPTAAPRPYYVEVFAVALAAIILEISYTRIFSFKCYYYFTYLVIGLSLLGLGTGGVLVAISSRVRSAKPLHTVAVCALVGSLAVIAGYFVIAQIQLNAFILTEDWRELVKLVVVSSALFTPFLAVGVVLATIFGSSTHAIDRLYAADLVGAGIGCAVAVPLISVLTPPGCVMLAGTLLAVTAMRSSGGLWGVRALAIVAALTGLAGAAFGPALRDPYVDSVKSLAAEQKAGVRPLFSAWSTVFRIDVTRSPWDDTVDVIHHDGNWGSILQRFDGDVTKLGRFDHDPRSFPFLVAKARPDVLVIGAAGGHELLASLHFDARHVTGVELNPVTYSLLTDHFAEFTGHLPENPRVTLVNAEGRSYLQRDDTRYDLVWFVAPDSYAAMNAATSGAFVLSESYLYTVEMIDDALDHLSDDGIVCAQFGELNYDAKPNRTARYAATAREALRRRGVTDGAAHIVVLTSPDVMYLSTVLVKKIPFTSEEVARLAARAPDVHGSVVRFPPAPGAEARSPVTAVLRLPEAQLSAWYAAHAYDLRPVEDDAPFFWHFARFRDALRSEASRKSLGVHLDIEDLTGERILVVLLAFTAVFAAVWLLLPFVALGSVWRSIPHKIDAAVYFAALGMGFMFFEVSLIQMLTLFLGYPSYSLSVTLFGMLVFGGIGSFVSSRWRGGRSRVLAALLGAIVCAAVGYRFAIPFAAEHWVGLALPVRALIATLLIAPLGLTLGAFMPIGLATVAAQSAHQREFVAWAWAVNGFLSVISSMLSTILAMILGFRTLMMVAALIYAVGVAFLLRIPAPRD